MFVGFVQVHSFHWQHLQLTISLNQWAKIGGVVEIQGKNIRFLATAILRHIATSASFDRLHVSTEYPRVARSGLTWMCLESAFDRRPNIPILTKIGQFRTIPEKMGYWTLSSMTLLTYSRHRWENTICFFLSNAICTAPCIELTCNSNKIWGNQISERTHKFCYLLFKVWREKEVFCLT